jgi:hypothetical protein
MSLEIAGGRLEVVYVGQRLVSLSELTPRAAVSAEAIEATAKSAADLWGAAQGPLTIAPGTLATSAKLQVSGPQAGEIATYEDHEHFILTDSFFLNASLSGDADDGLYRLGRFMVTGPSSSRAPRISGPSAARHTEGPP